MVSRLLGQLVAYACGLAIQRLGALAPQPKLNLIQSHRVLAPIVKLRAMVGTEHNLGRGGHPVIRGDMSVTEFVLVLWNNKIKVMLLILALAFGPGLYDQWQKKQAAEKLDADRASVYRDASLVGMMLMNAWRGCRDIGIVNDMERCAKYDGKLIQEQAAPMLAKMAVEHRDAYYKNCWRFHQQEYCSQLLQRSVALSNVQGEGKD